MTKACPNTRDGKHRLECGRNARLCAYCGYDMKNGAAKATHTCPSGMGGTFNVCIVSERGEFTDIVVFMPRNPDWHGWTTSVRTADLKPIIKAA